MRPDGRWLHGYHPASPQPRGARRRHGSGARRVLVLLALLLVDCTASNSTVTTSAAGTARETTTGAAPTTPDRRPRPRRVGAPQVITITYTAHNGVPRDATVLLPASYEPGNNPPIPLVISPHGRGATGRSNSRFWGRMPTRGNFAVVNPDGMGRQLKGFSYGYAGHIDDLARMPQIVAKALPWVRIDRERIYALGSSMGGQETLLLVARHPRLLAGAAAMDSVTDLGAALRPAARRAVRTRVRRALGRVGGRLPPVGDAARGRRDARATARAYAAAARSARPGRSRAPACRCRSGGAETDRIVSDQEHQSEALVHELRRIGSRAPLIAYSGRWAHSKEMRATALLPLALRSTSASCGPSSSRSRSRSGASRSKRDELGIRSSRRRARRGRAPRSGRSCRCRRRSARCGRPSTRTADDPPAGREPEPQRQRSHGGAPRGDVDRRPHRPARVPRARTRPGRSSSACRARRSAFPACSHAARRREREPQPGRLARGVPRLVDEHQRAASSGTRRCSPPFGGRYVTRWNAPPTGSTLAASPPTNVPGRHRDRELPVEARARAGRPRRCRRGSAATLIPYTSSVPPVGGRRLRVQRVGAGAHEPEQPRAVQPHVPEDALRLRAPGAEETGGERVRHHEVPVAAEARLGQRAVRPLAGEQRRSGRTASRPRAAAATAETARRRPGSSRVGDRRARVADAASIARVRPDGGHRAQPLPDDGLRVQPVDRVRDVGGVALGARAGRAGSPRPGGRAPRRSARSVGVTAATYARSRRSR